MRRIFLLVIVGVVFNFCGANLQAQLAGAGGGKAFDDKVVEKAIQKGVAYLWKLQLSDGSWPASALRIKEGNGDTTGYSALATYALIESGESLQDPRMVKALNYLAAHPTDKTYSLGVLCNVWMAAARKNSKFRSLLRRDAMILVKSATRGAYFYDCKSERRSGAFVRDNSASQYAVLGVWAARRMGEEIPMQYWCDVARHWVFCQNGDGGWGYRPNNPDPKSTRTRATMVAAGVATLFVCYDNVLSKASSFKRCRAGRKVLLAMKPIERGLKWFDKNFEKTLKGPQTSSFYYLYGVERVGLASGYKYFGQTDWYKVGVKFLLQRQRPNGSWLGGWGATPEGSAATSFALLFLVRGRNAVLFNKLQFPGDWNNRPRDLANLSRWISKTFESTINWQIINPQVPVEQWHDAPILYLSGSKTPAFREEELNKLRRYVNQGGTIFSVTECNGKGFKNGIREIYKKLFPKYKLTRCSRSHPLYKIRYKLGSRPRIHVLSNGVRPLAVHVDDDMSMHWQLQSTARAKWAYEAAVNISMYITDKALSLRKRGTQLWPDEESFVPDATVKIARLKYDGNYDPEPLAYKRFALMMGNRHKIKVEVSQPMKIADLSESGAKLAVLVGTEKFKLSAEQQADLKTFIDGGGTLFIDAAGGDDGKRNSKGFAASVKKLMREMFPDKRMSTLAVTAPLYNLPEMKIEKIRWRRNTKIKIGVGTNKPRLQAITIKDRLAVVFSPQDITAGLLGVPAYAIYGYYEGDNHDAGSAFTLMRNITLFAGK